jgi:hypothetical protein
MKLQAHMPTVSVGARDLRAAKIALVSLFVAAALVLTLQSGVLLDNPQPEPLRKSSVAPAQISVAHRVSLNLRWGSDPIDQWRRFSVAHPLPGDVASSQPFSIGIDERVAFEAFGDAALRDLLADERSERQFRPRDDRMLLMLMWLRLHTRRS